MSKSRESDLRNRLAKEGLALCKSRSPFSSKNLGGFMIIDPFRNFLVAGPVYELTLDEVEDYLNSVATVA